MAKIKLIKTDEKLRFDEIRNALDPFRCDGGTDREDRETDFLLGMPLFEKMPFRENSPVVIPAGQNDIVVRIMKKIRSRQAMVTRLKHEYRAVADALLRAGESFAVLNMSNGDPRMKRWLFRKGCIGADFPEEEGNRWLLFPRDMFVYLESYKLLLVHQDLFRITDEWKKGCRIIHSPLAEGGRVLFSGDTFITSRHPESMDRKRIPRIIAVLKEAGIRVIVLPMAVSFHLSRKRACRAETLLFDDHIDRSASLIRGREGGLFLVVDPGYRTGSLLDPLPVSKSVDWLRRICEDAEIEVVSPGRLTVPYGTAAVQLSNGKVLVSGGCDEMLQLLGDIVGAENVIATKVPLNAYPVFAAAGIHCLVTERPKPVI